MPPRFTKGNPSPRRRNTAPFWVPLGTVTSRARPGWEFPRRSQGGGDHVDLDGMHQSWPWRRKVLSSST
jgi:hypothetical protein